jgi:glycine/D-amino acid oxidase-like deaminating enzyme
MSLARRELLGALAGLGSIWTVRSMAKARPLRVGVVGGGIVGASIALHLARAGAQVTLFEKAGPGLGATQNSFAWVNAFTSNARYRELRIQSLLAYRELDGPLALKIIWAGYLHWARTAEEQKWVREDAKELANTAHPARTISAQDFARGDPLVAPGEFIDGIFSQMDGHLDPVFVTRRFLDSAAMLGANIVTPCEVTGLELPGGRLKAVTTTRGRYPLDRLVVSAGIDTPRLLTMAGFDLSLKHAPGILAHSKPLPPLTRPVHDAPGGLSFKQMADGSIVGTDALDPPNIPAHHDIRDHAMAFPTDELRAFHGNRILTKIGEFLPGARGMQLDRLTLGFRPLPLDEFPVMGALPHSPDVHVAVTHSGVTLAPIVGQLTADEVLTGSRQSRFASYRPERFAAK